MAPPAREPARDEIVSRVLGLIVLGASMIAGATAIRRARRVAARGATPFRENHSIRPVARAASPRGAAAGLHSAAALLALSVFADSAVEHSRGSYRNRGMYAPVGISALIVSVDLRGLVDRDSSLVVRDSLHRTALGLGLAGLGFHAWNIAQRPGRISWQNLFYAAPIGAPAALGLSGVLGLAADHLHITRSGRVTLAVLPAGRALAGLAAFGLFGTTAEAALLHFRGSFQSRYMWLPVTIPPVAAAMLVAGAARPSHRRLSAGRRWLQLTVVLGFGGAAFHARGISRMMGGWRNWSQNVVDGPPLPAPPSFAALALAGLAALELIERDHG